MTELDVCSALKRLGFTKRKKVRLYGEEFELLSDPIIEQGGAVVEALDKKAEHPRKIKIPSTVLQMASRGKTVA